MTELEDIEEAIARLSAEDLAKLRPRLEDFEGRVLDDMIGRDVKSGKDGKLGKLAAEALADHKAGCTRLP
jgi:hypothetical protein